MPAEDCSPRRCAAIRVTRRGRAIGKEPSSVRRFFTADVNPELKTVAALADVLGARVEVVAGEGARAKRAGKKPSSRAAAA